MEDVMATLNKFTADVIVKTIRRVTDDAEIFVSGGGIHNSILMSHLKKDLPNYSWKTFEFNADAKEAILFAVLANETVAGNKLSFEGGSTHHPNISMGKVSFPN
jgi:anhydro-N-acetylmuramic acid kinase